ncbi:hypothetical protein, partial [Vibrio gazogenes]|uniref:hypothetical protein n=1 Tax=Vibrio gazogenes TaxID=687 RepID=UPI001A96B037
ESIRPGQRPRTKPFFWVLLERQKYLGRVHQMPQKLINSLRTKSLHLNFYIPPSLRLSKFDAQLTSPISEAPVFCAPKQTNMNMNALSSAKSYRHSLVKRRCDALATMNQI